MPLRGVHVEFRASALFPRVGDAPKQLSLHTTVPIPTHSLPPSLLFPRLERAVLCS